MSNKLFPVFLNLANKNCLVVGGGVEALQQTQHLLEAGAHITVVSKELGQGLQELHDQNRIHWSQRSFSERDLSGQFLAVAATNDGWVNEWVFQACENRRIPVHVVDEPDHCNFAIPTSAHSGPVQVAVSTSGTSQVLAQMLREKIEKEFLGPEMGLLSAFMGSWRTRIRQQFTTFEERRAFWREVFRTDIADLARNGYWEEANAAVEALLEDVAVSA